jgi:hypothetical protein
MNILMPNALTVKNGLVIKARNIGPAGGMEFPTGGFGHLGLVILSSLGFSHSSLFTWLLGTALLPIIGLRRPRRRAVAACRRSSTC